MPERIAWAVELLDPRPGDNILEIGCGPGVAAALVCDRLGEDGRLTAIDRSAAAVERARRRLDETQATVQHTDLAGLAPPAASFDKAFAVNVNVFWTGPAVAELAVLRQVLRPAGVIRLVYEAPPSGGRDLAPTVAAALRRIGGATQLALHPGGRLLCVTGQLP